MRTTLTAALTVCCVTFALAQEQTRSQGAARTDDGIRGHTTAHAPTAPVDAKLVTENEVVQVFRMSVPARSKTPMHDISSRVIVWLSDASLRRWNEKRRDSEGRRCGMGACAAACRRKSVRQSDGIHCRGGKGSIARRARASAPIEGRRVSLASSAGQVAGITPPPARRERCARHSGARAHWPARRGRRSLPGCTGVNSIRRSAPRLRR